MKRATLQRKGGAYDLQLDNLLEERRDCRLSGCNSFRAGVCAQRAFVYFFFSSDAKSPNLLGMSLEKLGEAHHDDMS